jgi:hypothetical protein
LLKSIATADFSLTEEGIFLHRCCKTPCFFPSVEKLSGGEVFPRKRLQFYDSNAKNLQLCLHRLYGASQAEMVMQ